VLTRRTEDFQSNNPERGCKNPPWDTEGICAATRSSKLATPPVRRAAGEDPARDRRPRRHLQVSANPTRQHGGRRPPAIRLPSRFRT